MAKRVDQNQSDIVAALRAVGAAVVDLHAVGRGCPDILVGYQGRNYLMEIKTDIGSLNAKQVRWWQIWPGQGGVVRCADDALRAIGAME
jgi:hypothetical protein